MRFCLLILFLSISYLNSEEIDVTQPLRIHELVPREKFVGSLAVEPAIPKDFVALEKDDYSDWVYWGPEDVLKAYFKDPSSLNVPIIQLRVTPNVAQHKYGILDNKLIKQQVSQFPNFKGALVNFGNWGDYPYCLISGSFMNKKIHMAYVGLNDNSTAVLSFSLIIPEKDASEASALKLWNDFFNNTKKLPDPLFFKAHGQEMHPGYTIVDVFGHKIKAIGEKRKSDQKIRFVAIAQDRNIQCKLEKAYIVSMDSKWHHREPLLKVEGEYIIDDGFICQSMVTSILIKDVDEFISIPNKKKNVFVRDLQERPPQKN